MKITMMLADSAQVAEQKLYLLGAGWTFTGPAPSVMAVAAILEVPWDEANNRQSFQLTLNDEDGGQVVLDHPEGPRPVEFNGEFEVGRPPGTPQGADLNFPLAMNLGPLPLAPGRRFVWTLDVNGTIETKSFNTRPAF